MMTEFMHNWETTLGGDGPHGGIIWSPLKLAGDDDVRVQGLVVCSMGVAIGQEEEETALATVSSSLIHLLNNPIYVNYYRKGQLHIINKVTYYTLTHSFSTCALTSVLSFNNHPSISLAQLISSFTH